MILLITVIMVGFDPTMYTVSEGGVVSFTILRMTPATRSFSVIFNTASDSATGVPHLTPLLTHSIFLIVHPFLSLPSLLFFCFTISKITTSLPRALTFPPSPAAPDDYVAVLNQMVMFGPSDETQIVEVMVNNDNIAETVEMFLGRLSLPDGSSGVAISTGEATATITDTNG